MADNARRLAGFTDLSMGVDGGIAPNLISPSQCAQAVNVTFRGDFAQTRPTWVNHLLKNIPATWSGIFQGMMHYDGEAGQSGWLVARGGRFFFVTDDTFTISDVTPQLVIVTVKDFIQPGAGNQILVDLNGTPPVKAGDTVMFRLIHYTVVAVLVNQIQLQQVDASVGTTTTANYTQPAVGSTVSVSVVDSTWAKVGDPVSVATGGIYKVSSIPDNTHLVLTNTGDVGNAAPTTVIAFPQAVTPGIPAGTPLLDNNSNQIIKFETYPPTLNFVYIFQAENYGIVLGGQEPTLIWDGKTLRISGSDEVPSGFVGAYGWGRIWITRPDRRTFIAGDIVFGPSGTAQNGFRDAILKFTENDFLNEGGSFGVPYNAGPITAMQFLATQDTSLGIGVLLVGTTNMVFSVNAPVDRTTWKNLTYPIQTVSLIDYGPFSPRATISVNGDMWYRSLDGLRSFIVARRYFGTPGNTPMSHEMPIFDSDSENLLVYGSAMLFDNKLFVTISPFSDSNTEIHHRGLAVMNFDLVSDLRGKQPPAWEGVYTGLDILQIGKCRILDNERGFMWVAGATDIELWEMLTDGVADEFSTVAAGITTINRQSIASMIQTRAEDYGAALELKRLIMAEIYVEDIADNVHFVLSYKPDQYCNWLPWKSFDLCSIISKCQPDVMNCIFQSNARGYAARLTIPQPDDVCNPMTGKPAREFHDCQFKLEWTGHCRIRRFFTHIKLQTQPTEGICPPTVSCLAFPCCGDNLFTYDSHGSFAVASAPFAFIAGEGLGEPIAGQAAELVLPE